ncbi:MAG: hemolysin family protein [Actinomycetota bacterium]
MTWMIVAVISLVLAGSVLAMAEASISRMSRVRAIALHEEGRRNAALLEKIEQDPARYLNSVYLAVMFTQNGSAILVAILAERLYGDLGVTLISVGFTLLYFVLVEAMSKTLAIQRTDRVALAISPIVFALARVLSLPVKGLIGLSNVLLPGKGLKEGPFVTEEEIRSMADVGHEEGVIEEEEKELIHSIFEFGDTLTREVMVPRPDMVVVEVNYTLQAAMDVCIKEGFSRIPVFENEPDNVIGVVYAKDLFRKLRGNGDEGGDLRSIVREAYFVPETMRVNDLLREMQKRKVHMAIVVDEYGDVAGLVTMEDILEEIVGEITDEYDVEVSAIESLGPEGWRVQAKLPIWEFNEAIDAKLPVDGDSQTVGGLVASALGKIAEVADEVKVAGFKLRVERVTKRRIVTVIVQRVEADGDGNGSRS